MARVKYKGDSMSKIKTNNNNNHMNLLKKWCSDCEYKDRTFLNDPCHNCMEDKFVKNVPKYYKEKK